MSAVTAFKDWLFRWQRSDGTAPFVLGQRRIFILPTRAGVAFSLALAVMLVGAINYNLALGHALVFLLAGLGLVGMIHTFRNLVELEIAGGRCCPVFAGEIAHFPLHLRNRREEPRLALTLRAGNGAVVTCTVPADGECEVALPVRTEQRGWLDLPRVRLESRYPLGFFVAWSYPQPALRSLVYPRPLPWPLPPARPVAASGDLGGSAGQEDFAGLRPRQPADSPRHVAWKAAARQGDGLPLPVKEFSGGAREELWLDWAALPDGDGETRLSWLTGWVMAADTLGLPYGLRLPSLEWSPASGAAHRQRCLESLALWGLP